MILHLAKKRADKIAELFIVGVHYTAGKWWREEVRPFLLEGGREAPKITMTPSPPADSGTMVAMLPVPLNKAGEMVGVPGGGISVGAVCSLRL